MPSAGLRYTLVGFAADLDWRPVCFVKPIPPNRICSACGLVCRKTALLPCMHLLCQSCCGQCAGDGERVCPLDNQHCLDGDIVWTECSPDEILRREVHCWNEESGCADVMAASEISRHFQHKCEHHSVSCPKCSANVVRSVVCAHLRSECHALVTPLAFECEENSTFKEETAIFLSFKKALEEQVCEIRVFLEQLPADRASRDDRFNEICHSINTLNETLKHEMTALKESLRDEQAGGRWSEEMSSVYESLRGLPELMRKGQDSFTMGVSEILAFNEQMKECLIVNKDQTKNLASTINAIKDTLQSQVVDPTKRSTERLALNADGVERSTVESRERIEKTGQWTKQLFWMTALHANHCTFFVRGVEALKEAALKNGFAIHFYEKVYLRGYYISPGVWFKKESESVTLHVALQLHKGEMDDTVTWPFAYKVRLSVEHPLNDAKREIVGRSCPSEQLKRPTTPSNLAAWYPPPLKLDDLIRDGYVLFDRLHVRWHLLL